ncbi:hypothetical protein FHS85_002978 [Rhodoligotrophos appendicifer]|uniref:hypothetical protein n=1 Tax=Rhodoligotrophos appendicifer TaxID=987056 RepID=UPI001186AEA2|nr:hypothetical protein [Rhodoligotrophos appendicifer]
MKTILAAGLVTGLCTGAALAQTATPPTPPMPPAQQGMPGMPGMSPETLEALKPLNCTVTKVMSCKVESGCKDAQSFGDVPLPAKVLVDPEHRLIAGVNTDGLPHVSDIQLYSQTEYYMTVQGIDGQVGWMIHASRKDPSMTFTVASHHAVLTGFGDCKTIENK